LTLKRCLRAWLLFNVVRPQIIAAVGDIINRSDLARTIHINLAGIRAFGRTPEPSAGQPSCAQRVKKQRFRE
jgi:hypothetical protein